MLDVAVAYNRYKYLGNEFLTWLWFMMETRREEISFPDAESLELGIGDRVVLRNSRRNRDEIVTIKGDGAGLEEGLMALKKGAVVTELNLVVKTPETEWRFGVKGESLNISSLKPPEKAPAEVPEDLEQRVLGRMEHVERATGLLHHLYQQFVHIRVSPDWEKSTVPDIRRWIEQAVSGHTGPASFAG
jgi:hypothetical protein